MHVIYNVFCRLHTYQTINFNLKKFRSIIMVNTKIIHSQNLHFVIFESSLTWIPIYFRIFYFNSKMGIFGWNLLKLILSIYRQWIEFPFLKYHWYWYVFPTKLANPFVLSIYFHWNSWSYFFERKCYVQYQPSFLLSTHSYGLDWFHIKLNTNRDMTCLRTTNQATSA